MKFERKSTIRRREIELAPHSQQFPNKGPLRFPIAHVFEYGKTNDDIESAICEGQCRTACSNECQPRLHFFEERRIFNARRRKPFFKRIEILEKIRFRK